MILSRGFTARRGEVRVFVRRAETRPAIGEAWRDNDREFAGDIETVAELVREGLFERFVPGLLRDLGCE